MEDLNAHQLGLIGDCFHVFAVLMLFIKILHSRSVFGISVKSLFLFGLAYTIRCSEIYTLYISGGSVYMTVLKGVFLLSIYLLIFLTFEGNFQRMISEEYDSFPISKILILTTAFVAFFINYLEAKHSGHGGLWSFLMKVAWTFSIYSEAVAIIPQLAVIGEFGNTDAFMILYLIAMATFRGLYIATWAFAYKNGYYYDKSTVIAGLVEGLFWIFGLILVFSLKVGACECEGEEQKKNQMVIYNVNVKSDLEECTLIMKMNFNKTKNQTQMDQDQVQVRNVKALKVKMENECKNKNKKLKKVIVSKGQKKSNKK